MAVELTESLLSKAAGWDVMKQARAYLQQGQALSSHWAPPLLRGVVQTAEISHRASLVIKSATDMENLCTCREAREWGKICAHVVAVGLHWLDAQKPGASPARSAKTPAAPAVKKTPALLRDPSGEPAELFIILPPNLEQALARGNVMLAFEAKWSGGRVPLNALPKGKTFGFSLKDSAALDSIEEKTNGETPAVLTLEANEFASLLPSLADSPNITLGKTSAITVTKAPYPLPLRARLESSGEIIVELKNETEPLTRVGDWIWHQRTFQPLGLPPAMTDVLRGPVKIARPQIPQFLIQHWPTLAAAGAEANFALEDFVLEPQPPRFLLELKGGLAQLSALLQCAYGQRIMTVGVTSPGESVWLPDPNTPTRYSTRDLATERAAVARLLRSGFATADGRWQLLGQNAVLNFFARDFPQLQREWSVTLEERLERSASQNIERIEPQFRISSGVQWFDFGVDYASTGGEKFSAADIQRLLLSGQSHTRLKNGKMAVIDTGAIEELQEVFLDCAPQQHAQGYRISQAQAGFLDATLRQRPDWKVHAAPGWRERMAKQTGDAQLICPPLGNLENVLRPYQKRGVAWLSFLRENGFGGILADEMGLGKTIQTLALLRARPRVAGAKPDLVVCPTSLVYNWVAEAKKFTPELKALALHGPDRRPLFGKISQHDVIVTSYALIRRDAELYNDLEFDTVILDEAQHIKNRQTQNAQAVKAITAEHRLVLTGTPMENSVLDLWSIFDFLMPGYLGTATDFRERYELPITRDKDTATQARLARRLRPFILRRLKKEAAPELPARLEQVSFCELTSGQREVYQQILQASRKELLESANEPSIAKKRMVALNALLRLRQVCCDLRLLKLDDTKAPAPSGKLDLFGELLEEAIDGGHRVLVFSQFVSMLTLLKERLEQEAIEYCYLDGSTVDRASVVQRFQAKSDIPVFLISLKAGGVGLNLTGADTVIHFDPWWNPMVEDQATGRAHRIGQNKVVTSYKLIARDTVEEKILALQQRKRDIIEATLGGEDAFTAALSWDEIQELLA